MSDPIDYYLETGAFDGKRQQCAGCLAELEWVLESHPEGVVIVGRRPGSWNGDHAPARRLRSQWDDELGVNR